MIELPSFGNHYPVTAVGRRLPLLTSGLQITSFHLFPAHLMASCLHGWVSLNKTMQYHATACDGLSHYSGHSPLLAFCWTEHTRVVCVLDLWMCLYLQAGFGSLFIKRPYLAVYCFLDAAVCRCYDVVASQVCRNIYCKSIGWKVQKAACKNDVGINFVL